MLIPQQHQLLQLIHTQQSYFLLCISIINTPIIATITLFVLLRINTKSNYFYKKQHKQSSNICHSIKWEFHASYLLSIPDSLKRFSLLFIHHLLLTRKMLYETPHFCLYYKISSTPSSFHDYFLTCPSSSSDKHSRLQSINKFSQHSILLLCYSNIFFFRYQKFTTSIFVHPNTHYSHQSMHLSKYSIIIIDRVV